MAGPDLTLALGRLLSDRALRAAFAANPGDMARAFALSGRDADLLAAMIRYGATAAAVMERKELMAAVLPALRADLELCESLCPGAGVRLSCPITVFGGADDAIEAGSLQAWREFTADAFRIRIFPGGHFYLSTAGRALVAEIVAALRRPSASPRPRPAGAAS